MGSIVDMFLFYTPFVKQAARCDSATEIVASFPRITSWEKLGPQNVKCSSYITMGFSQQHVRVREQRQAEKLQGGFEQSLAAQIYTEIFCRDLGRRRWLRLCIAFRLPLPQFRLWTLVARRLFNTRQDLYLQGRQLRRRFCGALATG